MAARDVQLAVEGQFDAAKIASGFDDVGDAAKGMASEVATASTKADTAAGKFDGIADSADNMDSKAAAATGSLGAMSSGLELVGATGAAGTLQSVAQATDFLSGVGQGLNLILELESLQMVKAKAAALGQAAATKALAVGTKVMAAGQWLLNAALSANPIGIVVVAIAALVAGLILAYNKSDTFRAIVQKAMSVAKSAIDTVVDTVTDLVGLVKDKAAPIWPTLSAAVGVAKDLIIGYFTVMTTPIRTVIDLIEKVVSTISKINFPDLPSWVPGAGRVARGSTSGFPVPDSFLQSSGYGRGSLTVPVNVQGGFVGNERQLASYVSSTLSAELRRRGIVR